MTLCDKGGVILNIVTSHFCCINLIIVKLKKKCDVTLGRGSQKCDQLRQGRGGVKNHEIRVT